MRPSLRLAQKRDEALAILRRRRVRNPRIFGSVARGTDREDSDLDILVDAPPDSQGGSAPEDGCLLDIEDELAALLGVKVDVKAPETMKEAIRARALADALPLSALTALPILPGPETAAKEILMDEIRLQDCLDHIREAGADIAEFIRGMDRRAFLEAKMANKAVILSIINIGEAVTRIMQRHPSFVEERPDVPWQAIRGARNFLVHQYDGINLDKVWESATVSVPALLASLPAENSPEAASVNGP